MADPDLNQLITLSALLSEGSVVGAARRLRLSPSAMSRALARLRETMGDPLLVRAGRGLVPTPRALALRERVGRLVDEVEGVLRPATEPDMARVERTFALRTSDGFVENFGGALIARLSREAPGVRLRFVQKVGTESTGLRDGSVDLETGVIAESTAPELRARTLFRDRLVGVVRAGHPLAATDMTVAAYAAAGHVAVARHGHDRGMVDRALESHGVVRSLVTVVTGFSAALAVARASDLIATVPERHTGSLRGGMHTFALPFESPVLPVSMLWHPRMHADSVHRWLRRTLLEIVAGVTSDPAQPLPAPS
jgi:DNA-binding transcriptional LysR family regulator